MKRRIVPLLIVVVIALAIYFGSRHAQEARLVTPATHIGADAPIGFAEDGQSIFLIADVRKPAYG